MQDGADRADEAGEWLRENLKDVPEPKVTLTFREEGADPAAYRRILEILFRPRRDRGTT